MRFRTRAILRLSGKPPDPVIEKKSSQQQAASVFRRFFLVLARLDRKDRLHTTHRQDERPGP